MPFNRYCDRISLNGGAVGYIAYFEVSNRVLRMGRDIYEAIQSFLFLAG